MKKSLLVASLALLSVTSLSTAQAQERWPRWYVGLSGSFTTLQDSDVSGGPVGARELSFDNGYGFGGSIGYLPTSSIPLLNAMRFEAEVIYHHNGIDEAKRVGGLTSNSSGRYTSVAYMANAFYDFPIANSPWSPYVGGGVGIADLRLSKNSGAGNTDDRTSEFAYQGMVGIGYTPISIPNTQWSLGYRYLGAKNPKFDSTPSDVETDYNSHSVELGAKFRF